MTQHLGRAYCPICGVDTNARPHATFCEAAEREAWRRPQPQKVVMRQGVPIPIATFDREYSAYCIYVRNHPDVSLASRSEWSYDGWMNSTARDDIAGKPEYGLVPQKEDLGDGRLADVEPVELCPTRTTKAADAALAAADGWHSETENPKESAGRAKVSFGGTFPAGALVPVAVVFQKGADKYGRLNWRTAGIQATTYESAVMRHLLALMDGQDTDPESGQSHWAHIAAGAMIVLDAMSLGKVTNDRPAAGSAAGLLAALAPGQRSPR